MEEDKNKEQLTAEPCSVSSEVDFEVKLGDFVSRASVQVHIDSEDNVTLGIPEDFKLEDNTLTAVSLQTSAKVKVLPDILSTRFGSDNRLFYSACSIFVNVEFIKNGDVFNCSHCSYNVNRNETTSKEELAEMLLQHLPQHQDYLPCLRFSCKKCSPPLVAPLNALINHFEKIHPQLFATNEKELEPPKTSEKTEYTCPICSMICFNNKSLMRHMNDYHSSDSNNTTQILPDLDEMQNGIEVAPGIVVKQEPADYDDNDDEECDENEDNLLNSFENMGEVCNVKSEPNETEYYHVTDSNDNDEPPTEALAQKSQLLKVDLTLDGQFGCLICGKMCRSEKALKQHVQVHIVGFQPTGDTEKEVEPKQIAPRRTHKCKICKKSFESPEAVNKHKRAAHFKAEIHNIQSTISGDLKLTLKVEKKKDRRKQEKPQKAEELVNVKKEENTEKENSTEECDDFSNDPNVDLSTNSNDSDYDPYSDEPRRLRKRKKKQHFSKECPICHKVLTRANSMIVHMRSHTGEKPYKCPQCGRGCQTSQHLKQHMLIHTGEQPHECPVCKRRFRDPSSKKRHMRLHDAGRPMKQFIKPTLVLNPETGDMKEVILDPEDGTPISTEKEKPAETFQTATGKKGLFPCSICKKVFTSSSSLSTHHRSHTGERPYSCNYCNKTFLTSQHVKHHTMIHTGEKPHVCSECGKAFIARSSLKRHEEIHKANRPPRPPRNKPEAECEICGKQFMYAKSIIEHRRIHTKERPYSCTVCDKTFARIGNLRIHMYQHNNMYKHRCSHCGKGCVTASQLRVHEAIHTGVKPHVCSTCGKGFADPHRLKIHEYNHTDEKPHVCNICGKGYGTNTLLQLHQRRHTGEKPYLCTFCGKGFAFQKNMRDHQLTHTGELPFSCDHCGKGFRSKWVLTCHKRQHTGEKPYRCPKCGEAFRAHSSLYSHIRRHKIGDGTLPKPRASRSHRSPKPKIERPKRPEKPKNFFCGNCEKGFVRKESLKKHMRKNEACRIATNYVETGRKDPGITPFQCEMCHKYFSAYPALYRHRKLHERKDEADKFNCDLCDASFWRNDHLLVHKRTVHPDQYTDDYMLTKKPDRPEGFTAEDLSSGPPMQQQQQQTSAVRPPVHVPNISPPSMSPPLLPKNLSTTNRYEVAQGDELHNNTFIHRQSYQPQLHQPQFPYPQMISAQAFLQGAMSHLAQQQQQHQTHMSSQHSELSNNDRHTKSNQYMQ